MGQCPTPSDNAAKKTTPVERSAVHFGLGNSWYLWRSGALRAAGFPIADALAAASPAISQETAAKSYEAISAAHWRSALAVTDTATYRRAIAWQNPSAAARLCRSLSPGAAQRRDNLLKASYLQRYSTKNDTVGFFGPLAWVTLRPGAGIRAVGTGALVVQQARFESWAIDVIASVLQTIKGANSKLVPRFDPRVEVSAADGISRSLLQAAIGGADLQALCQAAGNSRTLQNHALERTVAELVATGRMTARIEMPHEQTTLDTLLSWVATIPDLDVRTVWLMRLTAMARALATAERESDPTLLTNGLLALDEIFQEVCNKPPTRAAGQLYGARTIAHLECVRDIDAELGEDLIRSSAAPLLMLLQSARWFTAHFARQLQPRLESIYLQLADGNGFVSAASFWDQVVHLLFSDRSLVRDSLAELRRRWRLVIPYSSRDQILRHSSDSLAGRFAEQFSAAQPGWAYARYVSFDLLVAGGARAPRIVVGETHIGNTLNRALFRIGNRNEAAWRAAARVDFPLPRISFAHPRFWPALSARTAPWLYSQGDIRVIPDASVHGTYSAETLPISEFTVLKDKTQLMLQRDTDATTVPLVEALGPTLTQFVCDWFKPFGGDDHRPRLEVDDVILSRESWTLGIDRAVINSTDRACRHRAIDDARRRRGLPRWCFYKPSSERKPIYVDFESAVFVDLFAATLRRSSSRSEASTGPGSEVSIDITEMCPSPEELWLRNPGAQALTSELRLTAVDHDPNVVQRQYTLLPRPLHGE